LIFVDSGAFIGRFLEADPYHESAIRVWDELARLRQPLVTSNFILDETFTILARRAGYGFAAQKARLVYASQGFLILRPAEDHELAALDWFEKFADQKVNFTDCVSFALMQAFRIQRAFTFDRHFRLAGFEAVPGPA
jgi:predicted nucleic acid-binding protein